MGKPLDALLKLSVIVAVLFASVSVGYYYLVYLPQRNAQLDAQRIQERPQADAAQQAFPSGEWNMARAEVQYRKCTDDAERNYDARWASSCKRVAEETIADRANCFYSKEECDSFYKPRDPSPNCALPLMLANDLQFDVEMARDRCRQESKNRDRRKRDPPLDFVKIGASGLRSPLDGCLTVGVIELNGTAIRSVPGGRA